MRRSCLLVFVLSCLLVLAGCSDKPYKSKSSYTSGYNDYLDAVEQAIGDSSSEYYSCTKEGCIETIKSCADSIKEDIANGGDYSTVSIQAKDFDNLKTTLKLFKRTYHDYIDPDDFEAEPLNPPDNEDDYSLGVEHAKSDLSAFFEENGDYVVWSEARGWIMDHMYALDSVDLNDCLSNFDYDNVDEDSWFDIDKVKHNHNLLEHKEDEKEIEDIEDDEDETVDADEPADAKPSRDLPKKEYNDVGQGTFILGPIEDQSESGDGTVVIKSTSRGWLWFNCENVDDSFNTYFYIDGVTYMVTEDLDDYRGDERSFVILNEPWQLSKDKHKVEVVQYKNNKENGEIIFYRSAYYRCEEEE